MNSFVLDASVAVKWYLPASNEPFSDEAQDVLDQFAKARLQLSAPDLFLPEVANVLWKSVRSTLLDANVAQESLSTLRELSIPTVPSFELIQDAMAIAVIFGRTVYDSLYVALASATGRPLLTADERLANAMATYFPIRWLGTWCA